MVKETRKNWLRKESLAHMLCPGLVAPLTGNLGVSCHWLVGINPRQGSPFGAAFSHYKAQWNHRAGLIPCFMQSVPFIHISTRKSLASKAENVCTEKAEWLELWVFLLRPENPRWASKMIAYGEWCRIRDLQRRRFNFGTRDQAWSLKGFYIADFY